MEALSFETFNTLEAIFWFFCALLSFAASLHLVQMNTSFWRILTLNFVIFGASDIAEVLHDQSFLEAGSEWLLAWKVSCIVIFVICLVWYLLLRK